MCDYWQTLIVNLILTCRIGLYNPFFKIADNFKQDDLRNRADEILYYNYELYMQVFQPQGG